MTIHVDQTVGELAAQSLAATRVFEDHGIDFCCGGGKPIGEACREKSLDPQAVLGEIEAAMRSAEPGAEDWNTAPLDRLIQHILERHHTYLRAEFPRLASWVAAVRRAHGARDGAMLAELDAEFTALREERVLNRFGGAWGNSVRHELDRNSCRPCTTCGTSISEARCR